MGKITLEETSRRLTACVIYIDCLAGMKSHFTEIDDIKAKS